MLINVENLITQTHNLFGYYSYYKHEKSSYYNQLKCSNMNNIYYYVPLIRNKELDWLMTKQ